MDLQCSLLGMYICLDGLVHYSQHFRRSRMDLHIFHFGRQGLMDNLGPLSTHIFYIGDKDLLYAVEDKYTWLYDSLPRIEHLYRTVHNGKGLGILSVFFQGKPE